LDGIFDWYWVGVALGLGVAAGIPGPRRESGRLFGGFVLVAAAAAGVIAAVVTAWAAIAALAGVAIGVPVLGYLTALGAPILGERLRRRAAGRYAGLRILAKD
jgi:hypothetical protein